MERITMLNEIEERLDKEINAMAPLSMRVIAHKEKKLAILVGGSSMGSLETFSRLKGPQKLLRDGSVIKLLCKKIFR